MLTVHTSLGPLANYTLQATVPPHLLSRCSSALPRPHWEPVLYYCIICIMSFLFFCICLAAYFEGDRIIVADIIHRKLKVSNSTQTFDKGKVFDLRNVAGLSLSPPKPSSPPLSSLSSSAVGQDLRAAAAKSMIHVNGHVEFHPQTNGHQPLLGRIIGIVRRLNPGRLFLGAGKSPALKAPQKVAENNASCPDKEPDLALTRTNSSKNAGSAEHQLSSAQSSVQEAAIAIDKTYTNHVKPNKKSKASKRHLVDSVSVVPSSTAAEDSTDYKLTKDSSIPSAAKKMAEADDDPRDRSTASEAADDYLDDDISPKMDSVHSSRLPGEFLFLFLRLYFSLCDWWRLQPFRKASVLIRDLECSLVDDRECLLVHCSIELLKAYYSPGSADSIKLCYGR